MRVSVHQVPHGYLYYLKLKQRAVGCVSTCSGEVFRNHPHALKLVQVIPFQLTFLSDTDWLSFVPLNVQYGVLQGSILGPIVFSIYMFPLLQTLCALSQLRRWHTALHSNQSYWLITHCNSSQVPRGNKTRDCKTTFCNWTSSNLIWLSLVLWLKTKGDRAYAVRVPTLQNNLPEEIRRAESVTCFISHLTCL